MVALFQPSVREEWGSLSFVSTLYLCPVLDRLLNHVPNRWKAEVRLGLQEALVNAVKHGNCLDPQKVISVRYKSLGNHYWWIIQDQGCGFDFSHDCGPASAEPESVEQESSVRDCGRGLYILNQVFDEVQWAHGGRELHLHKRVQRWFGVPLVC